jgi:RNA methyltransferase, TrmH family
MNLEPTIRSRSNSLLKRAGAVLAGKERASIVLEGDRLVDEALRAGLELEFLLIADDRPERIAELAETLAGRPAAIVLRLVESGLLSRVSALDTSPGILAVGPLPRSRAADELRPSLAPLVLVIAGVADPGNLGALARSAEAAGASAIVVVHGWARPFGAKALRGSMGSLLRLPIFDGSDAKSTAGALRTAGYRQVRAATRGGVDLGSFDWTHPIALWVSGETGRPLETAHEFESVSIPMRGEVESLNVTVAASLLLFAAGGIR